jgi:hypothetical protein
MTFCDCAVKGEARVHVPTAVPGQSKPQKSEADAGENVKSCDNSGGVSMKSHLAIMMPQEPHTALAW